MVASDARRFPLTIAYSDAGLNGFVPVREPGEPVFRARPSPTSTAAPCRFRAASTCTSPDPNNVDRGTTQSWNVFIERRLPLDIAASVGYVGTRTDGTYTVRNLNYAEAGGNANRLLFAQAGNATITRSPARHDRATTRSRWR